MGNFKLINIIKGKYLTIPLFLYPICKELNISSDELIFLMYLNNFGEKFIFDPNTIKKDLSMDIPIIMGMIDLLVGKGLIELKTTTNEQKILQEDISLTLFYNKIKAKMIDSEEKEDQNTTVYGTIEKEFGRPLSPMEYEIISAWLTNYNSEELVLEALKETVYNGVYNLRYMDVILNEWNKKGYKKVSDIVRKKEEKNKDSEEVFDYDWLNDNEE